MINTTHIEDILPVVLFWSLWQWAWRDRAVNWYDALVYWCARAGPQPEPEEVQALWYLRGVYDVRVGCLWLDTGLLAMGLTGCLAGFLLLATFLLNAFKLALFLQPAQDGLLVILLLGLVPPMLVMQFRKWRISIDRRREASAQAVFGTWEQAGRAIRNIRKKYPEAEKRPSLWAFPIRPGHAVISKVFETANHGLQGFA